MKHRPLIASTVIPWTATAALLMSGVMVSNSQAVESASWPQWRGPDGQGHSAASHLPDRWGEDRNVVWKTDLPGKGWSSPVMAGDKVWLTTAVDTPASAASREERLKTNTGSQPLVVSEQVSLRALCVDFATGKLLHDVELMVERNPQWIHTLNSYASPSPIIADGRLYCHFGSYGTACLDTETLKVLWTNRELRVNHENGPGSTPVLWRDKLIFHCDGSDVQFIAALDVATGQVAWKTPRSGKMNDNPQLKKAYGTPLIVEIGERPQVVSPAADWLYAYDPASGEELWRMPYGSLGFSIVPRPVTGHGHIFMCTSFMKSQLLAVDPAPTAQGQPAKIAWRYTKQVPNMSSPLLVGNELYMVSDKGIATCLDALTGAELWTSRLGGNFCSSPLYADGKIYFCGQEGETHVIRPGRSFTLIAKNSLDGSLMASPAAIGQSLLLRTDKALYRIADR